MHNLGALKLNSRDRVAVFLCALLVLTPAFAVSAIAQTSAGPAVPTSPPAIAQPPSVQNLKDWHAGMRRIPLPKKGCFTSAFPRTQWQEVQCTTAPARPYPPARGPRPATVGNGNDVVAQVTGHISTAVGSFDSVTGVTSENGYVGGNPPLVADTFSLQLNSSFFTTSTCNGAADPSACLGWQQFVYSNSGQAFMQYWLINYATTCPPDWDKFGSDCFRNSDAVSIPAQTIANLAKLSLTGQASSGGMDTIIFSTGSNLYSAQGNDSILNLAQSWQQVEFNIVGDCCGTEANFNNGSTIVVRTSVDSGSASIPSCHGGGFTGETNNLSFATAPTANAERLPAIVFTESSAGGANSPCDATTAVRSVAVVGDFDGDGKSDVLWRNTNGAVAIWKMNGVKAPSYLFPGSAAAAWHIIGSGDFDGEGHADILWHNDNGGVAVWLMDNAGARSAVKVVGTAIAPWMFAGIGDFDGDGKADILWRNTTTGALVIWKMDGVAAPKFLYPGSATTDWVIERVGDFDGDGKADILWRNSNTHKVVVWLMNGGHLKLPATVIGTATDDLSAVGTGDFDGDGNSDVLWYQTGGNVTIWSMHGTNAPTTINAGSATADWHIEGTGDFDGEGHADIVWRNDNGKVAVWLMDNAGQRTAVKIIGSATTDWQIQP